jgi:antitoxin CptB
MYQSKHRGCKETDILLGEFATQMLGSLSKDELHDYGLLLTISDAQIYEWLVGRSPPSAEFNTTVLNKIIAFWQEKHPASC